MIKCHICNKPVTNDGAYSHYINHSKPELVQFIIGGRK